jgi:hypothetical protein
VFTETFMTQTLCAALLSTSLLACQLAAETATIAAQETAICNLAVPAPKPWDGKSLPPFQSGRPAIFLYGDPANPKHRRALLVDDASVIAVLDLDALSVGKFLDLAMGSCPDPQGVDAQATTPTDLRCKALVAVVKVPPGPRPGSGGVPDAVLPVNLTQQLYIDYATLVEEIETGQLCPLPKK